MKEWHVTTRNPGWELVPNLEEKYDISSAKTVWSATYTNRKQKGKRVQKINITEMLTDLSSRIQEFVHEQGKMTEGSKRINDKPGPTITYMEWSNFKNGAREAFQYLVNSLRDEHGFSDIYMNEARRMEFIEAGLRNALARQAKNLTELEEDRLRAIEEAKNASRKALDAPRNARKGKKGVKVAPRG